MTAEDDPFRHLPDLRARVLPPEQSSFRNIDYREIDRMAAERGYPEGWRRPDADREATRRSVLKDRPSGNIWVFAYGSLMWDPAISFAEVRLCDVEGYCRRFCLKIEIGRGAPGNPGLMAALEPGDLCHGLAYRIDEDAVETETERLWRREMITWGYIPTWVEATTPQGAVDVLCFVANPAGPAYTPGLSDKVAARLIANGEGMLGRNFDYLDNLVSGLRALGRDDPDIFRLHRLAARLVGTDGSAGSGK